MDYVEKADRNRRLVVLRALEKENDGRLNESLISRQLDAFGHAMSRAEVRELLRWLEGRDAIRVTMAGDTVMVAEITQAGADHVARRGKPIDGIDLPSRI
ncbi:MAG: hypothetical protein AAFR17_12415 [Pseudomonadota bacterium]